MSVKLSPKRNCASIERAVDFFVAVKNPPRLETIENTMKLSSMIVQALWNTKSPLLQMPHIVESHLRYFETKKVKFWRDFFASDQRWWSSSVRLNPFDSSLQWMTRNAARCCEVSRMNSMTISWEYSPSIRISPWRSRVKVCDRREETNAQWENRCLVVSSLRRWRWAYHHHGCRCYSDRSSPTWRYVKCVQQRMDCEYVDDDQQCGWGSQRRTSRW